MSGEPKKPNIILITTDQQRYDTLGIAGNERIINELSWKPNYTDLKVIVESAWRWHKGQN